MERINICLEASMMASCVAMPKKGHLEQVHHVFGCLKKHHNAKLEFDPSSPDIDVNAFGHQNWTTSEFGNTLEEESKPERPSNLPSPNGIGFTVRSKSDADHAADIGSMRSRTGFTTLFE